MDMSSVLNVGCGDGPYRQRGHSLRGSTGVRAGTRNKMFALAALFATAMPGMAPPGHATDNGAAVLGEYVTVLTLARDGAWGTATETSTSRAIAFAIRDCKAMSRRALGCGAMFTTVRSGWSIAVLCGDEAIIAASGQLADAERIAKKREHDLRHIYQRNMPPCMRVATVNPDGLVIKPPAKTVADRQ